jgi:dihydrofolate reductase
MINIIAAVANNGIIGANGKIPWRCPTDLKHFSKLTYNSIVVMGRKTYESIGQPLPNRRNIVISSKLQEEDNSSVEWVSSPGEAIPELMTGLIRDKDAFIIGGSKIYQYFLGIADRMYLTRILADVDGDTVFPEVNWSMWKCDELNPEVIKGEKDQFPMQFFTYRRRQ